MGMWVGVGTFRTFGEGVGNPERIARDAFFAVAKALKGYLCCAGLKDECNVCIFGEYVGLVGPSHRLMMGSHTLIPNYPHSRYHSCLRFSLCLANETD